MKRFLFIFDMGGVVSEHCYVWKHICDAMGLVDADRAYQSFKRLEYATLRGDISSMEMLELVARRAQLPLPQENYWASFFHPTLNGGTVSLIGDLKAAGARVVCGSNTIDAHYAYHVAHDQYRCFDTVYASHIIGQAKPDITFWHYIKKAEKRYDFADIFFFDDMQPNVDAAASLGIHAHLFTTADDARRYIESVTGCRVRGAGERGGAASAANGVVGSDGTASAANGVVASGSTASAVNGAAGSDGTAVAANGVVASGSAASAANGVAGSNGTAVAANGVAGSDGIASAANGVVASGSSALAPNTSDADSACLAAVTALLQPHAAADGIQSAASSAAHGDAP